MNNILEYKGYYTKVEFDAEQLVLRGKIEGIGVVFKQKGEDIKFCCGTGYRKLPERNGCGLKYI